MLLSRSIVLLLAFQLIGTVVAQVSTDAPVILEGEIPTLRQVTGLAGGTQANGALAASVEQSGIHRSGIPVQADVWSYTILGASTPPEAGLHLVLQAPATPTGSIAILLNGSGPYILTHGPGVLVADSAIAGGSWISVVFDGTAFQLLNGSWTHRRDCPAGTIAVNDVLCMAVDEHPGGSKAFFPAIEACGEQGMRLCSWGEWIMACQQRVALGLSDMLGNWEWTNDAANEDGRVRLAGGPALPECAGADVGNPNTARGFRCCYSR